MTRSGKLLADAYLKIAHRVAIDWMMFTAAIATDNTLRDGLISQLHGYASPNKQNQPFEIVYNPITADQFSGSSRSAHFVIFVVRLLLTNVR